MKNENASVAQLHEHVSCELLLTTYCNMRCAYCIAKDLPKKVMLPDIGQKAIDMFFYLSHGAKSLEFIFTGGEPLLEYTTLKTLVKYIQQCAIEIGVENYFIIKTNGTILDNNIIDFIKENQIKLIISIDGISENHNMFRRNSEGEKTHHIIMQNLKVLLDNSINCTVSLTIHPIFAKTINESVRFLHEFGINYIEVGPVYGSVAWKESDYLAFTQSMKDVAQYIKRINKTGKIFEVGPLYRDSEHVGGLLCDCWGCGALSTNIAFMPDGKITGCSALAMLSTKYPEIIVGDIWEGMNNCSVNYLLQLVQADLKKRISCQQCEASINCRGGCLAINYSTNSLPFAPPDFYCRIISSIPNAWEMAWA